MLIGGICDMSIKLQRFSAPTYVWIRLKIYTMLATIGDIINSKDYNVGTLYET